MPLWFNEEKKYLPNVKYIHILTIQLVAIIQLKTTKYVTILENYTVLYRYLAKVPTIWFLYDGEQEDYPISKLFS